MWLRFSTFWRTSTCGRSRRAIRSAATHITAEAFKLAFADRAYWLGDADFVHVPRGLIDKDYAKQLAAKIDPKRAIDVETHGSPPNYSQDVFGRHTTHIAAADAAGNWVAITATVNTTFGSKVIVPGTGVVLNDEMDDFSIFPGMPNAFGLVGAENNSVAPGKRPLSSMSPTIVLDSDGKPVLTVGAAGGPKIITQVVLTIMRVLDYQESLAGSRGGTPVPSPMAAELSFLMKRGWIARSSKGCGSAGTMWKRSKAADELKRLPSTRPASWWASPTRGCRQGGGRLADCGTLRLNHEQHDEQGYATMIRSRSGMKWSADNHCGLHGGAACCRRRFNGDRMSRPRSS